MDNIYLQILDIQKTDTPLVLATVTKTVGSTPQKPGSSALFSNVGLLRGTVGGGFIEGEVQQIVQSAIRSGKSGYYNFKLNNAISDGKGAICGGYASVLIDASPGDHYLVFENIKQSLLHKSPGVLVSRVIEIANEGVYIQRYWLTDNDHQTIPGLNIHKIEDEIQHLLSAVNPNGYSELRIPEPDENSGILYLIETIIPPAHLVIAGAGHIGKALSHLGKLLDFEVTVIDDRPEYANAANLPDADHVIVDDISTAIGRLKKTTDTYVVIVTHGHKDDARALRACIGSDIAYIGMIGSKNKIALMRNDFVLRGWSSSEEWGNIHTPIGLDIQSKSIQEIAISIAAQLVRVKNSKNPAYV